jgi:hypothetical protein
MLRGYTVH